jgi:hypothetical protein
MIQEFHKGIEILMDLHQIHHGHWKCDFTLINRPGRAQTMRHEDKVFSTMDLAKEYALQEARDAIDRNGEGQSEKEIVNPPREVRIWSYPERFKYNS